jgi:histidinol-phosphate aminotransferase
MIDILSLVRPNIQKLKAYSSARSLYTSGILLDANENPYNVFDSQVPMNRYPDGSNKLLRTELAAVYNLSAEACAAGNGSDEIIDILFRIFCEPGKDNCIITSPTYGMYEVSAAINAIQVKDVPLVKNQLDVHGIMKAIDANTKMVFICSPNNPTGDVLQREAILKIITESNCLVVIDEAYADFMTAPSFVSEILKYKNLVVVRTLSKAFAMAGLRLGYAFADAAIIALIQKVKPPYNINVLTTHAVLEALKNSGKALEYIDIIKKERDHLISELQCLPQVLEVYPTQSNFILFRISGADTIFDKLVEKGIVIRSRTSQIPDALRVSIGTKEQNADFLGFLKQILA